MTRPSKLRRFAIFEVVQGSEVRTWTVEAEHSLAALRFAEKLGMPLPQVKELPAMLTNGGKGR